MLTLCIRYDTYLTFLNAFLFSRHFSANREREESGLNPAEFLMPCAAEALAYNGDTSHTNSRPDLV
jgi:hypothetical protein